MVFPPLTRIPCGGPQPHGQKNPEFLKNPGSPFFIRRSCRPHAPLTRGHPRTHDPGRSSDSRIILQAAPSHPVEKGSGFASSLRSRSQRRARSRFSRDSLLSHAAPGLQSASKNLLACQAGKKPVKATFSFTPAPCKNAQFLKQAFQERPINDLLNR